MKSSYLVFGLNDSQVVGVGAEGVQDVLLVLHPRLELLTAVVESMETQRLLQSPRLRLQTQRQTDMKSFHSTSLTVLSDHISHDAPVTLTRLYREL